MVKVQRKGVVMNLWNRCIVFLVLPICLIGLSLAVYRWLFAAGMGEGLAWRIMFIGVIFIVGIVVLTLIALLSYLEKIFFSRVLPTQTYKKIYAINFVSAVCVAAGYVSLWCFNSIVRFIEEPMRFIEKFLPVNLTIYLFLALLFFVMKSLLILFRYEGKSIKKKLIIYNGLAIFTVALLAWSIVTYLLGFR